METEAKEGVILLKASKAKHCQEGPQKLRQYGWIPPQSLHRDQPCQHLDFGLPAFPTVGPQIVSFEATQSVGNCFGTFIK